MGERKLALESYNCDPATLLKEVTPLHLPWEPHLSHL